MSWGDVWRTQVAAQLWREPAGRSIPRRRKSSVNVQLLTVDRRMIGTCKWSEPEEHSCCRDGLWSRTGSNSVQHREWLDMLKLTIWRRCTQWRLMSAGVMCSEHRKCSGILYRLKVLDQWSGHLLVNGWSIDWINYRLQNPIIGSWNAFSIMPIVQSDNNCLVPQHTVFIANSCWHTHATDAIVWS